MKNSLFKRAIAAAATVPLALTQCFTVATTTFAVDSAAPAAQADNGVTVTLNDGVGSSILYVAPDEKTDGIAYDRSDATLWKKAADWNFDVSGILKNMAKSENANGTLDLTVVYEKAIENSGEFKEVTKSLVDRISEVKYSVDASGNITITATLNDITPTFTEGGSKTIGGALKDLADQYGIEDFEAPDNFFDGIVIGGDIEIKINASELQNGTMASGELTFTDAASGEVYKGSKVIDWALEKFDLLKNTAKETCADYEAQYGIDLDDAAKQIDDSVSFYVDKLNTANDKIDEVLSAKDKTYHYDTMDELIADMKEKVKNKTDKTVEGDTAAEISQNKDLAEIYDNVLAQLNEKAAPDTFDITSAEIGELTDTFTDITLTVNAGKATLTAQFPDDKQDGIDAKNYVVNECGVEFIDSWKMIEATVDFSTIESGTSSASLDVWREIKVGDVITTTTTTGTTTTTEDTTTTTEDTTTTTEDSTTTTEDTTTTTEETTTTTEDSTTTTEETTTTTEETTTTTEDSTTTTEDTTTTTEDSTTTTEETTTTGDTSTSTDETTTSDTETTTTEATTSKDIDGNTYKNDTVVSVNVEADNGFYLSIDEEFNKDQVSSITYTVNKSLITINPDGVIIDEKVLEAGEPVDISGMFNFASTPVDTYTADNTTFRYEVGLVASQTIVTADGTIVAYAGEKIAAISGTEDKGADVTVPVFIGVKGDNDLDNKVTTLDASYTLSWYATISTLTEGDSIADKQCSQSKLVTGADDILDDFACFLCDVDNDADPNNFKKLKEDKRVFAPADASYILTAYATAATGTVLDRNAWDTILGY